MTDLTHRLRGQYPIGPMVNGAPEFGWRDFVSVPPIQIEAAEEIERLQSENQTFRNAQKICEDCDAPTHAEMERLRAELTRAIDDEVRARSAIVNQRKVIEGLQKTVDEYRADSATLQRARDLAAKQATDISLWRVYVLAPEERALQNALRELARVIERKTD